jgi:hypothetical protein
MAVGDLRSALGCERAPKFDQTSPQIVIEPDQPPLKRFRNVGLMRRHAGPPSTPVGGHARMPVYT